LNEPTAGEGGSVLPAGAAHRARAMTPLDIANIVTRNLVPIGGVLFFHWSAPSLLILYFADTLLAMTVLFAGLMHHFFHTEQRVGLADRINNGAGYVFGALFLTAVIAVPLGMPIAILVFGTGGHSLRAILDDNGFRIGLALQAAASLVSFRELIVALRKYTPEELRLKRRFAILFLRWFCVIALAMTPFVHLFGRFGALLLVVAYAGLTIFTEVNPTRFLAMMGEKDDVPVAGRKPGPRLDSAGVARSRDRHRRRHKKK
jgi:hypothetical protein